MANATFFTWCILYDRRFAGTASHDDPGHRILPSHATPSGPELWPSTYFEVTTPHPTRSFDTFVSVSECLPLCGEPSHEE